MKRGPSISTSDAAGSLRSSNRTISRRQEAHPEADRQHLAEDPFLDVQPRVEQQDQQDSRHDPDRDGHASQPSHHTLPPRSLGSSLSISNGTVDAMVVRGAGARDAARGHEVGGRMARRGAWRLTGRPARHRAAAGRVCTHGHGQRGTIRPEVTVTIPRRMLPAWLAMLLLVSAACGEAPVSAAASTARLAAAPSASSAAATPSPSATSAAGASGAGVRDLRRLVREADARVDVRGPADRPAVHAPAPGRRPRQRPPRGDQRLPPGQRLVRAEHRRRRDAPVGVGRRPARGHQGRDRRRPVLHRREPGGRPDPGPVGPGLLDDPVGRRPGQARSRAAPDARDVVGPPARQGRRQRQLRPGRRRRPAGHLAQNAPIGQLDREYGHHPGTVARHVVAFVDGMRAGGGRRRPRSTSRAWAGSWATPTTRPTSSTTSPPPTTPISGRSRTPSTPASRS